MPTRRRKDDFLPEVPQDVLAAGSGPTDIPYDRSNPVVDNGAGGGGGQAAPPVPDQGAPAVGGLASLGAAGDQGAGGVGGLAALGAGGSTDQLTGQDLASLGGGGDPISQLAAMAPEQVKALVLEAARRSMMAPTQ